MLDSSFKIKDRYLFVVPILVGKQSLFRYLKMQTGHVAVDPEVGVGVSWGGEAKVVRLVWALSQHVSEVRNRVCGAAQKYR